MLTLLLSSKYLKADENVTDESDKVTDALGEVVTEQTESKVKFPRINQKNSGSTEIIYLCPRKRNEMNR